MNRENKRMARNTLNGLAIGALLFLGGLFLTIWSWGFAAPLGIPMMLMGVAFPFLEAKMAKDGKTWLGGDPGKGAVMTRQEGREKVLQQANARHQIDSSRYNEPSSMV